MTVCMPSMLLTVIGMVVVSVTPVRADREHAAQ